MKIFCTRYTPAKIESAPDENKPGYASALINLSQLHTVEIEVSIKERFFSKIFLRTVLKNLVTEKKKKKG